MSVALSGSRIAGHKCTGAQAIQTKHLMGADNVLVVILSARTRAQVQCMEFYSQIFESSLEFNSVRELPYVTDTCQQTLIFSEYWRAAQTVCVQQPLLFLHQSSVVMTILQILDSLLTN